MKRWKVKGLIAAKYEIKHLHFRETFKPRQYRELKEITEEEYPGVSKFSQGKDRWHNQRYS